MKKIFLLILLTIHGALLHAQEAKMRTAEEYYLTYQYALASKEYEAILQKDPSNLTVKEKLALCYQKLNNSEMEEQYLSALCKQENVNPQMVRQYAEVLAKNGKYKESARWYIQYSKLNPKENVSSRIEAYQHMDAFYKYASFYTVQDVGFNSSASDFSPAYYKNGLVFCSARAEKGKKYTWSDSYYIDLYQVSDIDGLPVNLSKAINSALHEGPLTFTPQYDTLYFTRNNKADKNHVGLKICYSVLKNGQWGKAKDFELNHKQYSIGHPAFAPDGKLYFTSDMPGGLGGTDLYFTRKEHGQWITPVNLGPSINTAVNEMFPFISEEGDLYFASNGHVGMGGLDIFQAKAKDTFFAVPQNLGSPINSSKDDFALIVKNQEGYFSSNRGENHQDDNIYAFTIDKSKVLSIVAYDQAGSRLDQFTMDIRKQFSSSYLKEAVAVEKAFTHIFDCEQSYEILASKEGYKDKQIGLSSDELLAAASHDTLKVTLEEVIIKKTIFVDLLSDVNKKLFGGTVILKNTMSGETQQLQVAENTAVSFVLTKGNSYEIKGTKTEYKPKTIGLTTAQVEALTDGALFPIILTSVNTLFDENAIGTIIEINVKYDVGKATVRPDAAKELDRLVDYLKKTPKIKVELGSHTDARGSDDANFKLSQKRAESAVNYVVAKGIKSDRLIPLGYGEKDLKIANAQTEAEHQENRRTTVKIVAN